MAGGGREETAHVSGQHDRRVMSVFCGKLETCSSSISGSEKTLPAGSRVFTGRHETRSLRDRSRTETIRPVRSEGLARVCKVVKFDLGGVEDAQEECKVGPHAEEERDMDCESGGGDDGERVMLLPRPRTPSKAEGSALWCLRCRSGMGADIVWLAGVSNIDIRSIQGTMINIHLCPLTSHSR